LVESNILFVGEQCGFALILLLVTSLPTEEHLRSSLWHLLELQKVDPEANFDILLTLPLEQVHGKLCSTKGTRGNTRYEPVRGANNSSDKQFFFSCRNAASLPRSVRLTMDVVEETPIAMIPDTKKMEVVCGCLLYSAHFMLPAYAPTQHTDFRY
jgi:hypothetical protein